MTQPKASYSFLETWAEWISVTAVAVAIAAIAFDRLVPPVLLATGGVAVFGVILQLTRPLRTEEELGAIFRLAYAFALLIGLGATVGLVFLNRPFLTSDPVEECLKAEAAAKAESKDGEKKSECEATAREVSGRYAALAILPGCSLAEGGKCGKLEAQWVISLGGHVLECSVLADCEKAPAESDTKLRPRIISGGLVVPVYFVLLTLLGGLVSMARRLPEYQHRAAVSYIAEFAATRTETEKELRTPMSFGQARDYVVFQMIQVLSAPVIGVVAFSWAEPEKVQTTTLLAFAAGFSSDVFLLAVRNVAERFVNSDLPVARPAQPGAATPPRGKVEPGGAPGAAPLAVGDRVKLVQPVGPFRVGDSGKVIAIDPNGAVTVQVERAAEGQVPFVLAPQEASFFAHEGAAAEGTEGPVG